jgi:hypothetical protein
MSALMVALYRDHATAERVRTELVMDGFPTDRVEVTAREEPGVVAVGPADKAIDQLKDYFRTLFDRPEEQRYVEFLAESVCGGAAAVTVHPRGDIETERAREILERAGPLELEDKDLDKQSLEQAASPKARPTIQSVLFGREG